MSDNESSNESSSPPPLPPMPKRPRGGQVKTTRKCKKCDSERPKHLFSRHGVNYRICDDCFVDKRGDIPMASKTKDDIERINTQKKLQALFPQWKVIIMRA